jgi:hypothetical protein
MDAGRHMGRARHALAPLVFTISRELLARHPSLTSLGSSSTVCLSRTNVLQYVGGSATAR